MNLNFRTSALLSAYNYEYVHVENLFQRAFRKFYLKTRLFGFLGFGTKWAPESMLFLAGANPERINENKFTRAEGVFTKNQTQFGDNINTFHSGGGLNLRGYAGYLAPEFNKDGTIASFNYNGTSGASFNTEVDFTAYLPYSIRKYNISSYLFADAGIISSEEINKDNYKTAFGDFRADAGIGFTYTFQNFGPLESIKPLVIRFDMPLVLNRAPASDDDFVQMRWLIGINRAF